MLSLPIARSEPSPIPPLKSNLYAGRSGFQWKALFDPSSIETQEKSKGVSNIQPTSSGKPLTLP